MIIVYDDQLLHVMSNQHVELYKCIILTQYLNLFTTKSVLVSPNSQHTACFDYISIIVYVCNFVNFSCIACVISRL